MRTDFLDFPTAWQIQNEVGPTLPHDELCSSVYSPAFLCDCPTRLRPRRTTSPTMPTRRPVGRMDPPTETLTHQLPPEGRMTGFVILPDHPTSEPIAVDIDHLGSRVEAGECRV